MINLDPRTTALVLIDLQKPIVAMPLSPYSGDQVLSVCVGLAGSYRVDPSAYQQDHERREHRVQR